MNGRNDRELDHLQRKNAGPMYCLRVLVLAGGVLATPSLVWADTRVVFTVDVESNEIRLPDQVNAVCADGAHCGLMEIARLLQERHWSGTFFLNVYEHKQWGERAMRDIAVGLQEADQDVALHTHPQWAYDPNRWAMFQYNLDDQTTIVRDGVRLLQAWTGRPVVAHRAGAYTADEHTLIALERNGVLLDSSLFWQYPNNRLDTTTLPRNVPGNYGRVREIPVTVYLREDRPGVLQTVFDPVTVVRKIDPNWFINEAEMRAAIDAAVASDLPVLVVFFHSFSFMGGGAPGSRLADRHAIEMFHAMLDHVAQKHLKVVSMRDLADEDITRTEPAARDLVPRVTMNIGIPRYAWGRLKASRTSSRAVGAALTILLAGAALVVARRGWKKARSTAASSRTSVTSGVRLR